MIELDRTACPTDQNKGSEKKIQVKIPISSK